MTYRRRKFQKGLVPVQSDWDDGGGVRFSEDRPEKRRRNSDESCQSDYKTSYRSSVVTRLLLKDNESHFWFLGYYRVSQDPGSEETERLELGW